MVVVDGYNLIGQEAGALLGLPLEKERENLVRKLEQMAAVSGEKFLVVFDSSIGSEGPATREFPYPKSVVSVAFSKSGQTADRWILNYLSHRPKRSAILVTRDRELARKAIKLGFRAEPDLTRLETKVQPYLTPTVTEAHAGGDLLSSLSRPSREALARARKKFKH